jgi:4'-phosphopantetheinyl transferase
MRQSREYQAAHMLKRLMLTAAVDGAVPPSAWEFEAGGWGKPEVVSHKGLHFSLSRTDGLVACAVSQRVELGVDVERLDGFPPLDVAHFSFAPAEKAWLRSLLPEARSQGFFQLWTLKEACVKANGMGLSQPLDSFCVRFNPLRVNFADPSFRDPAWHLYQCFIGAQYVMSLAWRSVEVKMPIEVVRVRAEKLLNARA